MTTMNKSYEDHINEVKNLLKEKVPSMENLLEVTLKKERENQEIKNRQVLEVLKFKDSTINELQKKNNELNMMTSNLQEKISDNQVIINDYEKITLEYNGEIEKLKFLNAKYNSENEELISINNIFEKENNELKNKLDILQKELNTHIKQQDDILNKYK